MFRPLNAIFKELIYFKCIACNNLSEDGMQGPKHVGGLSESNKCLWLHMRFPPDLLYNGYRVFPGVKSGRRVTLTPQPF